MSMGGLWAVGAAIVMAGIVVPDVALAQSQPIRSAQDAACRDEARSRVFTAPDPQGIGLYAVGRQIYTACMNKQRPSGRTRSRRAGR
ncbi:hypothetical protein [Methylobacterium sp. Leaf108]|nr:hypothetical protein [Methylobacterium sp. Leaf108]